MSADRFSFACAAMLLVACGRDSKRSPPEPSDPGPAALAPGSSAPVLQAQEPVSPTRLTSLAVSAYATSLAIDDDAVYLLTSNAAYRLVAGQPAHGIRLDLGIGPVLTQSAFVFWSEGSIWSAPKQGGVTRQIAKFPHQPQYFVASGDALAWVDQSDEGLYSIQTLVGSKPRILVSSTGEIRALNMIGDAVYFVQRPTDGSWRIGVVRITGGAPEYAAERKGRAPALLSGSDDLYYYDLDKSQILKVSPDLQHEEVQLKEFVCSPIQVSSRIYCGCVEGLFDVSKQTLRPTALVHDRPGSITNISSNSKHVAWTVDVGAGRLAVDMLLASPADDPSAAP